MTNEQKIKMYAAIEKHGRNLLAIFPAAKIKEPVKLCKALRRLETKAHQAAENWCNGLPGPKASEAEHDIDYWADRGDEYADKAAALLGPCCLPGVSFKFNGDARGYALKLEYAGDVGRWPSVSRLYSDMGGYGIVAPDFTPAPAPEVR